MTPVEKAPFRYYLEIGLAFLLYIVALFGRVYLLKQVQDPALATAITVSPILPILLMALAVYRFYRRIDEFHRIRMLKVGAASGGLTAVAAGSWSFLADAGAPPLTNFGALFILCAAYGLVTFLYRVEDAAADGRIGQSARILSWISTVVLVVSGFWFTIAFLTGQPWGIALAFVGAAAAVKICVSLYIGPSAGIA